MGIAILDAFADRPRTLAFVGDLLIDHRAKIFGAIVRSGAFRATGTIWFRSYVDPFASMGADIELGMPMTWALRRAAGPP